MNIKPRTRALKPHSRHLGYLQKIGALATLGAASTFTGGCADPGRPGDVMGKYGPTKSSQLGQDVSRVPDQRLADHELHRLLENTPTFSLDTPWGRIDYARAGNPNGPTILYIPGIPGQKYDFGELQMRLAKRGYDVVSLSPTGLGYSTRNDNFRFRLDEYAAEYRYVIKALGLHDITLIGNSFGGLTTVHTLTTYGPKDLDVSRLVLFDPVSPGIYPKNLDIPSGEKILGSEWLGPPGLMFTAWMPGMGLRSTYEDYFAHFADKQLAARLVNEYLRPWYQDSMLWGAVLSPTIVSNIVTAVHNQNVVFASDETIADYALRQAPKMQVLSNLPCALYVGTHDHDVDPDYSRGVFNEGLNRVSQHPGNRKIEIFNDTHLSIFWNPDTIDSVEQSLVQFITETTPAQ